MNVPSNSSYQSTCVTRTVQSINKSKMKAAGVFKYGCPQCYPPTAGGITSSNCVFDEETDITTCDYTVASSGGTSFQWFYISGSNPPQPFVNGANISGSQTQTLRMGAVESDTCIISSIYCIVTNNCGSAQSSNAAVVGGCPIVQ